MICGLISPGFTRRPGRVPRFRPLPLGLGLASALPPPAPRVLRLSSRRTLLAPAPRWGATSLPVAWASRFQCALLLRCAYIMSHISHIVKYVKLRIVTRWGKAKYRGRDGNGKVLWFFLLGTERGEKPLGGRKNPGRADWVGGAYIEEQGALHLSGRSPGNEGHGITVGGLGRRGRVRGEDAVM